VRHQLDAKQVSKREHRFGSTVRVRIHCIGLDAFLETADVALMDDDLSKLADCLTLSRRTSRILMQNIVPALGIKAVFLVLALTGQATLWMAVFADMGASLLVVFNGPRLLRPAR
jgi:Cd2+/Zn2+-exporting ATPase